MPLLSAARLELRCSGEGLGEVGAANEPVMTRNAIGGSLDGQLKKQLLVEQRAVKAERGGTKKVPKNFWGGKVEN